MRFTKLLSITLVFSLLGGVLLRWWFDTPLPTQLTMRIPQPSSPGVATVLPISPGDHCNRLQTTFEELAGVAGAGTGKWPCFMGSRRNNICTDPTPLANVWPEQGPPVMWSIDLGEGHAGAAIYAGRVYVLDYDETEHADSLRCLALTDGQEIWRRSYPVRVKRNHGMSRTVPAVSEDVVVTIGPKCHVMCVERETGDLRWGLDLVRDYGATVPLWYTAQCPLIDGEIAVLAPAGRLLMMGIDCKTGEIIWEVPNPDGWRMSHSSIMPMKFNGHRAYVY